MKTILKSFIAVVLTLASTTTFAQPASKTRTDRKAPTAEEITERRANHLIAQLGLDDTEAAKFKEIYIRYAKETQPQRPTIKPDAKKNDKKAEKKVEAPQMQKDSDIDAANKARYARQRAQIDLQERFYNEFRTVLSARQTNTVMNNRQQGGFGMRQGRMPQVQGRGQMPMMRQHGGFGQHQGRMPQVQGHGQMPMMRQQGGFRKQQGRMPQMPGRMPQAQGQHRPGFGMPQMQHQQNNAPKFGPGNGPKFSPKKDDAKKTESKKADNKKTDAKKSKK